MTVDLLPAPRPLRPVRTGARDQLAPPAPPARGPLSARLLRALEGVPGPLGELDPPEGIDVIGDEDAQIALYIAYELHYRGLAGVDERWENHPDLVRALAPLERAFEAALRTDATVAGPLPPPDGLAAALLALVAADDGPSLSSFMAEHGRLDHLREFAVHRSLYQLKEADPHSWALPRLSGQAKTALVEIQADEYGNGVVGRSHAELFADTLEALDLDATYGAYVDLVPASTLATVNLVTLFGRHRRLRGALVGHLAAFEMTSVEPMGRYASAFRRLGVSGHEFYDVHVAADRHHQVVAAHGLAGGLAAAEPALVAEVLFGAAAVASAERRFAARQLRSWSEGRSSLRGALDGVG